MGFTQRFNYEAMRSIDSATFTGSYQALGTPLLHPCSIIKVVNNSSVIVTISIDGTNDMDICPSTGFFLYDYTSDTPPSAGVNGDFMPAGTQYYVKGSSSTGLVYLVAQYIVQI